MLSFTIIGQWTPYYNTFIFDKLDEISTQLILYYQLNELVVSRNIQNPYFRYLLLLKHCGKRVASLFPMMFSSLIMCETKTLLQISRYCMWFFACLQLRPDKCIQKQYSYQFDDSAGPGCYRWRSRLLSTYRKWCSARNKAWKHIPALWCY